jgi:hypothetical protein
MKKLFVIIFFVINLFANFLVYDKTHSSYITNMIYYNGEVITASKDGTLRMWNVNNLEEYIFYTKTKRFGGDFYALTQNKDYVLASGVLYKPVNLYIFKKNRFSLKHIKTIKLNSSQITSIAISKDNKKFLIATKFYLNLYSFKDFKQIKKIPFRDVFDIKFIDNNKIILITFSGKIVNFDLEKEKVIAQKGLNYHLLTFDVVGDKIFVGGYNNFITEFDFNLKYITKFNTHDKIIYKINHQKNYLLASGQKAVYFYHMFSGYLLDLQKRIEVKNGSKVNTFLEYNVFGDVNFAYADGNILKISNKPYDEVKSNIYKPLSVVIGKNSIKIDSFYKFNLKNFKIKLSANKSQYINYNNKEYNFKIIKTKSKNVVKVYKNNKLYSTINRTYRQGYRHLQVKWYKDYIASIGEFGIFYIYKTNGKIALEFIGSNRKLISFDIKDNLAVAVDKAGIIYFWDLSEINIKNCNHKKINYITKMVIDKNLNFAIFDNHHFYTTSNKLLLKGNFKNELYKNVKFVNLKNSNLEYFKHLFNKNYKETLKIDNIPLNYSGNLFFIYILKDKKHILIGDKSNIIKVFDIEKGKVVNFIKLPNYIKPTSFYQEKPNAPIYIGSDYYGGIYKVDSKSYKIIKTKFISLNSGLKVRHINIINNYLYVSLELNYPNKFLIQIYNKNLTPVNKDLIFVKDIDDFTIDALSKIEKYGDKLYFSSLDYIYFMDLKDKKTKKFSKGYLIGRYKNYLLSALLGNKVVRINLNNNEKDFLNISGDIRLIKDKIYEHKDRKIKIFDIKTLKLIKTINLITTLFKLS